MPGSYFPAMAEQNHISELSQRVMRKYLGRLLYRLTNRRPVTNKFHELPWYCGSELDVGIDEVEEWRDWSNLETTPDQKRIEAVLSNIESKNKTLLHVGVGNSELAEKFYQSVDSIDGITIQKGELMKAESLHIPGYRVFLLNKYSFEMTNVLDREYDIIIDNNPSSFACCRKHFYNMLSSYYQMLKPGGLIVTDKVGLGWSTTLNDVRWGLSPEEWFSIGKEFNMDGDRFGKFVIALRKKAD